MLSNRRVSTGGLPEEGLSTLCPNITDLDLSSNLLESWADLLPLLSQLSHLKFLNLSRNHITRHKVSFLGFFLRTKKLGSWGTGSIGRELDSRFYVISDPSSKSNPKHKKKDCEFFRVKNVVMTCCRCAQPSVY